MCFLSPKNRILQKTGLVIPCSNIFQQWLKERDMWYTVYPNMLRSHNFVKNFHLCLIKIYQQIWGISENQNCVILWVKLVSFKIQ